MVEMVNKGNSMIFQMRVGLVLLSIVVIIQSFEIQQRIINGASSNPEKYRYYVQIRTMTDTAEYNCGGSLISDRFDFILSKQYYFV